MKKKFYNYYLKPITRSLTLGLCALFFSLSLSAQADYRSVATGTWSSPSTWQVRSGGSWSTPASAPTSANSVYLQNGFTVLQVF
jgi:hypothetical protein